MAVPLAIILGLNLFGLFINVSSSPVAATENVFPDDIHIGNLTAESSSVPSTANSSNAGSVICNGWKYGHNPPKASCEEAWHSIPRSGQRLVFGRRGDAAVSKPLPIRWLSCQ